MNAELLPLTPTTDQRAKMAYVYIRQSSLMQVTRHAESTELQYSLVERAVKLGWPRERVAVIDEDLGKSGADAFARGGFQYLLAEISLARAGLVLSFDASRLARNNRDWYQLLEVCSIFGTLIADGERLYDPRLYHDRLLLGLTGMLSEAELHQLKQRMQAGARHKAERGELRQGLPVGLARGPAGEVILNPDEEVQARIRLVAGEVPGNPLGRRHDAVSTSSAPASASSPSSRPRSLRDRLATSTHLSHPRYAPQSGLRGSLRVWTQAI
jgi:DNA invertase Pin-like site-specific DNA recombinase